MIPRLKDFVNFPLDLFLGCRGYYYLIGTYFQDVEFSTSLIYVYTIHYIFKIMNYNLPPFILSILIPPSPPFQVKRRKKTSIKSGRFQFSIRLYQIY